MRIPFLLLHHSVTRLRWKERSHSAVRRSSQPLSRQLKLDAQVCFSCACSRLFHLLFLPFHAWPMTSNEVPFLGFRALVTKQLADFFPGTPFFLNVVYKIYLSLQRYLSLYSNINCSASSFDQAVPESESQLVQRENGKKWLNQKNAYEKKRPVAGFNISCPHCARNFFAVQLC